MRSYQRIRKLWTQETAQESRVTNLQAHSPPNAFPLSFRKEKPGPQCNIQTRPTTPSPSSQIPSVSLLRAGQWRPAPRQQCARNSRNWEEESRAHLGVSDWPSAKLGILGRVASHPPGPPSCSQGQLAEESALPGRRLGVCLEFSRPAIRRLLSTRGPSLTSRLPSLTQLGDSEAAPSSTAFHGVGSRTVVPKSEIELGRLPLPSPSLFPSAATWLTTAPRWQATRSRSTRRQRPQPSSSSSAAAAAPPSRQSRASRAMCCRCGATKRLWTSTPWSWPISCRRLTLKCSCTSSRPTTRWWTRSTLRYEASRLGGVGGMLSSEEGVWRKRAEAALEVWWSVDEERLNGGGAVACSLPGRGQTGAALSFPFQIFRAGRARRHWSFSSRNLLPAPGGVGTGGLGERRNE